MKKLVEYLALMRGGDFKRYLSESWSTSWPMIIIMLFEFLINLTDVYIAGILGKEIQATVGFVSQVYFIFIVVAYALTTGTVSVIARLFTSGDRSALSNAVYTIIFSVAVSGLVLGVLGITLSSTVIGLLNVPEDIKTNGIPLIEIYAGGLLFHYLLINSNGILRHKCGGGYTKAIYSIRNCYSNPGLDKITRNRRGANFRNSAWHYDEG